MSTTVKYKGNIITTVNNNTKTLKTAGKYMEGDVELTDTSGGASVISIVDELDEHGGTIRHINAVSLEGDTVSAEHLEQGYTAHNSLGEEITGTLVPGGGGGNYQSKTGITPSTSSQTIVPDSGYDALSSVQINAMPSGTAGTPTASKGTVSSHSVSVTPSVTNAAGYIAGGTVNGEAVTVSASELVSGTYSVTSAGTKDVTNYASASVPSGSATAPSSISGSSASVSTGTNTLTLTKTISVTPSVSAGYVSSGTAGNASVSLTASVTTQAAQTIHPSTSDQSIASGRYLTGAQTVKAVTHNLDASKILSGTTFKIGDSSDDDRVASVAGTLAFQTIYSGSSTPSSSLGVDGDVYIQT